MANANSSQTGYMGAYDAADVTNVVDGAVLFGFQSGDFVTWEWDNDKISVDGDSYGTFVLSKNNKNSGSVTYNLSQESPCNAKFAELANSNKEFAIDVRSDTEHVYGAHCGVTRIPSGQNGDASQVRSWQVKVLNLEYERLDSMPS
ncbi:hypothetical protein LASUN_13000 [Lentilactobacillus sunkii]|jgi:hypothetical protein|uniref:Uncharacterized protein n=1 Tax=Lentilactobacillus sunkii TaxID=481719 RepID=A0A1E7XCA3_9LACO|nr:hypothetical protein [Lentilactobacillus sunkii]OFA10750.1 hypothetical protein LASUN_13000 [Lentilactobacillus sunkii]